MLALTGCALFPSAHQAAEPKPIETYAASESLRGPEAAWRSDRWWETYQDPQLSQLVTEAQAGAPSLQEAAARLGSADALQSAAGAALFPNLSAGASVNDAKLPYHSVFPEAAVPKGWNAYPLGDFSLNWQIDFWGKNRAALAAATSDAQAAQMEVAEARLVLSTSVASAYADLGRLFDDQVAAKDALRVLGQTADLLRRRYAESLEHKGAAERADSAKSSAEADLAAINEAIGLTRNRIAALIGAGPDRGLTITPPPHAKVMAFGLPSSIPADLIGRRPDVIAARLRAEAAGHRIKEARAAFYPNVNLMALIGVQSLGLNMLTKAGSDIGSVGAAVTLPILDGGRLRANYRGAEAEHDLEVAQYNDTVAHALQDVANAVTSSRALDLRLSTSRTAAAQAASAFQIVENRYRGGLANYLEVLAAEDSLIATRRAVAELETRAFTLDVELVRALGGGHQP
jgi:NodT family efflux transporter outer membrane factor (OMF) lipoprotein